MELSDELLRRLVHLGVLVCVFYGEGRVRDPELPHHGAAAETRQQRGGLHHFVVQHLEHPLDCTHRGHVVVAGGVVVALALVELKRVVERVGVAVAAAELVLFGRDEGEGVVGAAAQGGVVMEHEVPEGFSGDLASLEHEVEINH